MANVARMPQAWLDSAANISVFDDFNLVGQSYSVTKDAGITTPAVSGLGGILGVNGDTTDNDEVYVYTGAIFKPGSGYALEAKALVQYSEANTSAANVIFGFVSSPGADVLVDNGAGPRTSGNIIAIYKVDGGTVWRCVTRWGSSTSVLDTASTTTAGGSAYAELAVSIADGGSSGTSAVSFFVDGVQLKDSNGSPIIHYFVNSGAAACAGLYGLKQGSTTAESSNLQKWLFSQSY